jgi:uncharacterized protein (DUF169 family)
MPSPDLQTVLGLERPPIAIGFFDSPPSGVPAWEGESVAAGCVFWKKAQEGHTFYTVPSDHYNCAVGAYTHQISLPGERAAELGQTVQFMVDSHYIAFAEVPGIPTLAQTPGVIAYGPVESAGFTPDVVVVAARPAQAMLIYEAAVQCGASGAVMNVLGRPGCAILPMVKNGGSVALSLGCKGNRTFTGLPDAEMYLAVAGDQWENICHYLTQVDAANQTLGNYYTAKQATFAP